MSQNSFQADSSQQSFKTALMMPVSPGAYEDQPTRLSLNRQFSNRKSKIGMRLSSLTQSNNQNLLNKKNNTHTYLNRFTTRPIFQMDDKNINFDQNQDDQLYFDKDQKDTPPEEKYKTPNRGYEEEYISQYMLDENMNERSFMTERTNGVGSPKSRSTKFQKYQTIIGGTDMQSNVASSNQLK